MDGGRREWVECAWCDVHFLTFDRTRRLCTDCWVSTARYACGILLLAGLLIGLGVHQWF